jgi:hypothetical protein
LAPIDTRMKGFARRRRLAYGRGRITIRVEPIHSSQLDSAESSAPAASALLDLPAAPDLTEPLTAFRRWRVVDGRLRSPYLPVFWDEPVLAARCRHDHSAPDPSCGCGIHAYNEPDLDFPAVDYRGVSGIVTIRGKVAVGADGMRAEAARVEALGVYSRSSGRHKRDVAAIAGQLGVDLVDLDDLAQAAWAYGRPLDPQSLASAAHAEWIAEAASTLEDRARLTSVG